MPRPLGLLRLMPFMLLVAGWGKLKAGSARLRSLCLDNVSNPAPLEKCHLSKDRALSCTPLSPLPSGTTSGSRISSPKRTIHETTVQPVRHVTSTVGKSCAAGKCVTLRASHALGEVALTCFDNKNRTHLFAALARVHAHEGSLAKLSFCHVLSAGG